MLHQAPVVPYVHVLNFKIISFQMMRNIFLKCYNTYKLPDEPSISDSYCLNNMKFSPRLFEIKVSQRMESVAYIDDCDMYVIAEGEAARSYNFNTGMYILRKPFRNKPLFLRVGRINLLKTLWEKEKLLVTSNFSFSYSVFHSFG